MGAELTSNLNTACEGAFRSVKVIDTMNAVSTCIISFDYHDLGSENAKNFSFNTEISVHLGYKDDVKEVFYGEITGQKISLPEFGSSRYAVRASSFLQRLNHAKRNRVFEKKSASQAIIDLVTRYNLQIDCEDFGVKKSYWQAPEQTDFELIKSLADHYGKDICSFGKKVYVKERMTHLTEEIIYEWGKSLIDFRTKESIKKQVGSVQVIGWNPMRAEGSGEGNQKLSAGMEVTVKYVGKAYSGDYIAEAVIHDFSIQSEGFLV